MLDDLPRAYATPLLRCWRLAGALACASLIPLWTLMDEPFWCLTAWDVLALLVLPAAVTGGWLFVLRLVATRWHERGMRLSSLLLPLLAVPSLLICFASVAAYLGDLRRSSAVICEEPRAAASLMRGANCISAGPLAAHEYHSYGTANHS